MRRSVKLLWTFFFIGLIVVIALFSMANFGVFGKMPSLQELENPEADLASEIMSADGVLMGKYYSENRSEVKYNEISPNVIHALVATEDQYFYDHSGIDPKAVARAFVKLGTDGGGSSITQQLAKMILHQGGGNKLKRGLDKVKEWIIAVKLERNFTKDEIITLYLNRAPWGNVYGIRNASRTYFQKEPIDLNIQEAAVLVGMLKGYRDYNPITRPESSKNRRNTVIDRMVDTKQHYLTQPEANKLKATPLITNFKKIDEAIGIAPYYRNAIIGEIKKWCNSNINPRTGDNYDLYRDGLRIYTTIDSKMQAYAEKATAEHLPILQKKLNASLKGRTEKLWKGRDNIIYSAMKYTERWKNMKEEGKSDEEIKKTFYTPVKMKIFSWGGNSRHEIDSVMTPYDSIKYHKQLLQTSFVAIDPRSGEVKAYVGGPDFRWFKFDNAQAMRQVGSTIKPLLYTLAVTDAGYTPETIIPAGAITLNGKTITSGIGGGTLASCLARSLNGAAWRLIAMIGARRLVEFAHQCGITVQLAAYPSLALGAAEIPMLQMLQAYTMFPNKGYNTAIVYMTRIEDKNGNLLHEFPLAQSNQVIPERDAYTMVKMMQGVIQFGTARRVQSYKIPVEKAGKTGTTNNNTDGWFIGYTPELLAGSWVGAADPFIPIYQNNAGGAEMSAPRWGLFMQDVYADKKLNYGSVKEFEVPLEMKNDPISADPTYLNSLDRGDSLMEDNGNGNADDFFGGSGDDFFKDTVLKTPLKTPEKKNDNKPNPEVTAVVMPAPLTVKKEETKRERKKRLKQEKSDNSDY